MDAWDDDVLYSPDPPEHGVRCPYGHPDATTLGYCRAEARRMVDGLTEQHARTWERGDATRAVHLARDIVTWTRRLA